MMWIRFLLHAVVAPAVMHVHVTANVAVRHLSSVHAVSKAEAKAAPGVPTTSDPHRSRIQIVPSLRGQDSAISDAVLTIGNNNNRRLQEGNKQEKNEIFHAEDEAAKTRAHLAKIAEQEMKNLIKEEKEAAKDAEKEAKEAAKDAEKEEAERIEAEKKAAELIAKAGSEQGKDEKNDEEASKDAEMSKSESIVEESIEVVENLSNDKENTDAEDFFHMPELTTEPEPTTETTSKAETEPKEKTDREDFFHMHEPETETETTTENTPEPETEDFFHMPEPETKTETGPKTETTPVAETTNTARSQEVPTVNSSQGGIRSMTPGGKFGVSLVFIVLFVLIFVAASPSRRKSKREKYWEMDDQTDDGSKIDIPISHVFCVINADSDIDTNADTNTNVEAMGRMHKELDDIVDQMVTAPTQDADDSAEGGEEGFEIW